jgi:hypothetical protein
MSLMLDKEGTAPLKALVDLDAAVRNRESEVLAMEQIREEIVNLEMEIEKEEDYRTGESRKWPSVPRNK